MGYSSNYKILSAEESQNLLFKAIETERRRRKAKKRAIGAKKLAEILSFRAGEITRDPSAAVSRLKIAKTKVDPFSETELALALSHIHPHCRPFFTVQAFTGARPNELLALRWQDIDWVNKQISINKGRVRGAEGLPKTSSGERLIPMTMPVVEALTELKDGKVV